MNALPDLLRLLSLPLFGWAAVRDVRTRRVPNRTWLPLLVLGAVLLAWDVANVLRGAVSVDPGMVVLRLAISLGVVAPLGVLFWRVGAFGGADAKALATLCLLFPFTPLYRPLDSLVVPLGETSGVFSLTVLTNAALVGGAVPFVLFARNALAGRVGLVGFLGRPVRWRELPETHGRLLARANGLEAGLDLDALRMYLRWRETTVETLRASPDRSRDPASLPAERPTPGDGAVEPLTDGGERADPWGAAAFLDAVEGSAYGTTPARLRAALDALVRREHLWVTPAIPFLVPLFVGLCLALVYGDLLYAVLGVFGLF
ncbi:A24 family peptidase [Halococcus thailandensis]|uniref:Peptidase A24B, FlaK domain-containing protein n=1 Tax=Halococcus thailandensis JCM 13552 TaxID=1227457 RepID=M0N3Y0_9EURY|nr:A24 family peptidase [Halococcus thailandensis]EMA52253.1 peptidase A24B, FlaK domain-containing protein [Halococcus thailandensis JCM 13552]